jgi:hypothetical protein
LTDERDEANAPAVAAQPGFRQWAAGHGYMPQEWTSMPDATQLLRHGFMQEIASLAYGAIPGVRGQSRVAIADFAVQGNRGLQAHWFTLVLIPAPESIHFATRILCHDRGLDELERSNPDASRQVIELDDQAVRLESEAFLQRFTLSADHDQDNVRTWQLFDPALVDWLTKQAPQGFSFELQDGALCCFVKGPTGDAKQLDDLCAAAARVFARVDELVGALKSGTPEAAAPAAAGSRTEMVSDELAAHEFTEPPASVKDAAKALRHGLLLGDEEWKLGAEAFFREYAKSIGFAPMELGEFRAAHLNATVIEVMEHIGHGRLPGTEVEGFLALSNDDTFDDLGYVTLFAPALPGVNNYDFATDAEAQSMKDKGFEWSGDASRVYCWLPDKGPRHRKRKDIDAFVAKVAPVLTRLVTGGRS